MFLFYIFMFYVELLSVFSIHFFRVTTDITTDYCKILVTRRFSHSFSRHFLPHSFIFSIFCNYTMETHGESSSSSSSYSSTSKSSMNAWIDSLLSQKNESIETEILWHKSETPNSLLQLLQSDHIPSIITFFTSNEQPPQYQTYGYTSLLLFQTIGMTRLSSILMRMNHSSTSLILSQIVQLQLNLQLPTNDSISKITSIDEITATTATMPYQTEIQYLLSILLYALQPMAGLTSASAVIWRSICDISHTYPQYAYEIHIVRDARNCLVQQVLHPGIKSCCNTEDDGGGGSESGSGAGVSHGKKMAKLLNFFLGRLESLLTIVQDNNSNRECMVVHHDYDEIHTVLMYLILWRGQVEFSPYIEIQQLGSKIDGCLEKWVYHDMLNWRRLQDVLTMRRNDNHQNNSALFSYGKWIFLIHLVDQLVESYWKQQSMERDEWDGLHSILESLLFDIIPKCHEIVTTVASNIMSRSLATISDVLLLLERCPVVVDNQTTSSAMEPNCLFRELHQHLLKWLAWCHLPSICDQSMDVVHPLTHELVLTMVYLHIIRSFSVCPTEHFSFISHMLRLCSKLLFSDLTNNSLRSNISTLIHRILSNDALPSLKTLCESFVVIEAQNFVMSLQVKKMGKRKRNEGKIQQWKVLDGYADLLPIFSKILNNVFWARLGDSTCDALMGDIEVMLQLQEAEESQSNRLCVLTRQAPILLCIACSLLMNCPSVSQMKKEKVFRFILTSLTFGNNSCDDSLHLFRQLNDFVDQQLGFHNRTASLIQSVFQRISKKPTTSQKFGMCIVLPSLSVFVNENATGEFIKVSLLSSSVLTFNSSSLTFCLPLPLLIIQTIQGCFAYLIGNKDPCISATAMSSMELFGPRISSKYRQIIPNCVPSSHQIYLQTRIKGGDHIYSLSSKAVLQMHPNDICKWRRHESKHLDSFVKEFFSEGRALFFSISKNYHVYELSDGNGKSMILFSPPNDQSLDLGVISKWQISKSGTLSRGASRSDGTFNFFVK